MHEVAKHTAPSASRQGAAVSEFLNDDEIVRLTGYAMPRKQIEWLIQNGWRFECTGAGRPVVGRLFARFKLAGIKPTAQAAEPWSLDLSKVS